MYFLMIYSYIFNIYTNVSLSQISISVIKKSKNNTVIVNIINLDKITFIKLF